MSSEGGGGADWAGGAIRQQRPSDELRVSQQDYLSDRGLRYVRPYHFHFVANVKKYATLQLPTALIGANDAGALSSWSFVGVGLGKPSWACSLTSFL
mmetsp:Transcript_4487/g.16099  ORF Transcript_4487/g.16099 Transcript_4487/m.16099 type:complete len:97 (+) Transcript_4487:133-423(+)